MTYDYLILATGVSASHFGIKGADEFTYGLYTRRDAVALRDRLMADVEGLSEGAPGSVLDVTMVGGGATGVELAGTVAELRDTVLRETFPDVNSSRIHVRLVEMQSELLTPFDAKLRAYTRDQLVKRGVDVRLDTAIAEVTPDRVILKNGQDLHSDITVWTAGRGRAARSKAVGPAAGPRRPDRDRSRPAGQGTGPHLRGRRHRPGHGQSDAPAFAARHPDGAFRGRADPADRGGPAHWDVPLPRQGPGGHDRPPVSGHRAGPRARSAGHARLARLAGPAPVLPARRAEPDLRNHQPRLAVHDVGARRHGHRRGRAQLRRAPRARRVPSRRAARPPVPLPRRPSRSPAGQPEPGGQPQRGGQPENDGQPAPAQARPSP